MKILGLIVLLALMIWSWLAFYGGDTGRVSEQTMVRIQNDLQEQIYQILKKQMPDINNVKFEKFWTEQIAPNKVKANFLISYDESMASDTSRVTREGSILLNKLDETPQEQVWVADKVDVAGEQIVFEKGLKFKAGEEDTDEDSDAPASDEASPEQSEELLEE